MIRLYTRAALLAALFLPAAAMAQAVAPIAVEAVPLPSSIVPVAADRGVAGSFAGTAQAEAPASTSAAAPCTATTTIANTVYNTFDAAVAGGLEDGQSFTATCDGYLDQLQIGIRIETAIAGQTATFRVNIYQGAGTTGPVLSSILYAYTNRATAGNIGLNLPIPDAFPVVTGQTYTYFIDLVSGPLYPLQSNANPYAGGQNYYTTNGNPASAVADPAYDLYFSATVKVPVTSTQASTFNGPGWRLLSTPVGGVSVHDLAALNLVQGIPADVPASLYAAEYPTFGTNFYTGTTGTGGYVAPASTAEVFTPGVSYFWYWYDQAFGPYADGTSQSRELTGFTLSATGPFLATNQVLSYALRANGWYQMGNPFTAPLAVSGITKTAGDGTLGTAFQTFDPSAGASGSFVPLFVSNPSSGTSDYAAVWQGFFGSVTGSTTAPSITYAIAATNPSATAPFYGRGGDVTASATPYVQLHLNGTTASGTGVSDVAAYVRFMDGALMGWDANDMGKMLPPAGPYALVAPMGERDGAPLQLAVNSLPADVTGPVSVPVSFLTTEAGTFALTWEGAAAMPQGWSAVLTDAATGAVVDLRTAAAYTFAATAGDWDERFTLTVTPAGVVTGTEPVAAGAFRLGNVAPNPTAGAASLALRVGTAQDVRATVYDALGREVAVAFDGPATPAADVVIALDAARLAPGAYVVRVEGATFQEARRVTVVR